MEIQNIELMPAEYEALLAILRRDYRAESLKSTDPFGDQSFHHANARMCIRLLELFNPKRRALQRLDAIIRPLIYTG